MLKSSPELHVPSNQFRQPISFFEEKPVFSVGFAKRSITPDLSKGGVWLAGFFPSRTGWLIHDELFAKCLVIRGKNNVSVGIVSTDLLGFLPSDIQEIEKRVSGFFHGKLLVHTTHTHSAPDVMGLWGFNLFGLPLFSGREEEYVHFVKNQIAACVKEADEKKEPAVIAFGETRLEGVARIRAGAEIDDMLSVMHVRLENRSLFLVNFAVHPNLLYSSYITADLLQYTYDYIEKETGGEVLYVNGAIGAVHPQQSGNIRNRWGRAKELGTMIGRATLEATQSAKISTSDSLFFKTALIRTPLKNKQFIKAMRWGLMRDERQPDGTMVVEVNYVIIGDGGILTYSGEVFPNIALALKKNVLQQYKFTFGLTNGGIGYILTSEDFHSGRYRYHTRVSVSPVIGDQIFDAITEMLASPDTAPESAPK
ncbi:MAG: hypothetical protein G01um101448_976 [Parcubacteria group bacterium Gr01-1014_48]|nr:MAG: hypothetical protein Greene041614_623 [Parcubacteria group bacterium Greene0416_14]TSC72526.1 MAG: hypothetical protein G01um101448_976 [Parcubacteria group bacterium Gr01-1014_48]TSD00871.1 MAG: hypothetical protein Greene101415_672 [Parcubacteria group bacterium Greene1014_15]TSD07953.1 MAG: hypothetical protein Greene07144_583 [Parcubacteria group bacterium Greene0714_4]